MKINLISNANNSFSRKSVQTNSHAQNKVSFKSIYVEDSVKLGEASQQSFPAKFLKKDALLLNKIASAYPNQDCFIRKGYAGLPKLEYREKPPEVQSFSKGVFGQYTTNVNPNDPDYPTVPLLLDGKSNVNSMIGIPSYISLNPSLPYTVKAGYELHKKLIQKKYQIMEAIGKTDGVVLGEQTLTQKAHEAIRDVEVAVKRYLLESAYLALGNRASASQLYASNYPKVQSALDAERTLDLTTSVAKQSELKKVMEDSDVDICDFAIKKYPNYNENIKANETLEAYMAANGIIINQ